MMDESYVGMREFARGGNKNEKRKEKKQETGKSCDDERGARQSRAEQSAERTEICPLFNIEMIACDSRYYSRQVKQVKRGDSGGGREKAAFSMLAQGQRFRPTQGK